ncbi:MAG: iron ABC transporter substrate-binding protein [Thermodesulfobacteriota bacterium]
MKRSMRMLYFWMLGVLLVGQASIGHALEITDMAGRKVSFRDVPKRILCLGPGALRLIVYLDAASLVCGIEEMEKTMGSISRPYLLAHPELLNLPICGPGGPASINQKPDMELILATTPDAVFVTYMDAALADAVQKTLGIPVFILNYGAFATFDTVVYDTLRTAGKVLNRSIRAETVISGIEALRSDLHRRTAHLSEKPGVYVGGIGYRGAFGIESTEKRYIPFDWVHARNLAETLESKIGSHVFIDKEILLRLDPDFIFLDGGGALLIREDARRHPDFYASLRAFRKGKVYWLLPFNSYATNVDTALADAYAIGKILYPQAFEDVDPERKADDIYSLLVGKPIYAEMKKTYGALGSKWE